MSPLLWLGIALVVAIALMAIFGALFFWNYGGSDGGYYGMMGGGSWGWSVLLMGIPAVILIVILVVVLAGIREPAPMLVSTPPSTALETLNSRYARNEISREEFLRMKADLTGAKGAGE